MVATSEFVGRNVAPATAVGVFAFGQLQTSSCQLKTGRKSIIREMFPDFIHPPGKWRYNNFPGFLKVVLQCKKVPGFLGIRITLVLVPEEKWLSLPRKKKGWKPPPPPLLDFHHHDHHPVAPVEPQRSPEAKGDIPKRKK